MLYYDAPYEGTCCGFTGRNTAGEIVGASKTMAARDPDAHAVVKPDVLLDEKRSTSLAHPACATTDICLILTCVVGIRHLSTITDGPRT
jgi:hypothetical protein